MVEQELLLEETLVKWMPTLVLWMVLWEKTPTGSPHAHSPLPFLLLVN